MPSRLLTNLEAANDVHVAPHIDLFQVIQQPPAAANHHQKAAPTSVVFLVRSQMLGQTVDSRGQYSNLNLRRARIVWFKPEVGNQFGFTLFGNCHLLPRLLRVELSLVFTNPVMPLNEILWRSTVLLP